jgi:hypothetical protein
MLFIVFSLLVSGFLASQPGLGPGLGLRSLPRTLWNISLSVLHRGDVDQYANGDYRDIIFLHHSTGENLIQQGGVRQLFADAGYSFWDQGYNSQGLHDPNGLSAGYGYSIPRDNTDPDGMAAIFNQHKYSLPLNAFSGLLQHEVILFKSCFAPTSNIRSESQLEEYRQYYLAIRDQIDQNPNKLFVLITQPPLNPAETNPEEARRARELASWLASPDFLGERNNVAIFDLFSYLAENDPLAPDRDMLRSSFRNGSDSHPNRLANEQIAPLLVEFVISSIESYRKDR